MIPRHLGGHSLIKHIVVIVKENRTYDQVLGDLGEGNGDAALAQFGKQVTPNLHALAKRFGDLDNFYDEGTLSADGHNWIVQAEANDYIEKEFGETSSRTYPAPGRRRARLPARRFPLERRRTGPPECAGLRRVRVQPAVAAVRCAELERLVQGRA